jgi:hypothetical protein
MGPEWGPKSHPWALEETQATAGRTQQSHLVFTPSPVTLTMVARLSPCLHPLQGNACWCMACLCIYTLFLFYWWVLRVTCILHLSPWRICSLSPPLTFLPWGSVCLTFPYAFRGVSENSHLALHPRDFFLHFFLKPIFNIYLSIYSFIFDAGD